MDINSLVLGDKIETKKPHPCGGKIWELTRKGADMKIKCLTCGRIVMLTPDELKQRIRRVLGGEEWQNS
ncbi:MAG: DUF951 domain-containing protein [Clostridia bacterium]|nr:DUF951 domain-containing protein [Clostridia bacterium]